MHWLVPGRLRETRVTVQNADKSTHLGLFLALAVGLLQMNERSFLRPVSVLQYRHQLRFTAAK